MTEGHANVGTPISEQLAGSPKNWQRWGADDQIGALNFLGSSEVLRGVASVRTGRPFTLGIPIAAPGGDPIWPGRSQPQRFSVQDKSTYVAGHARSEAGDEFADDTLLISCHGTTHTDALGHVWYDETLYNGYPATSTVGRLAHASVLPVAERGIVGRGVLIDIARLRGKLWLDPNESFGVDDVLAAAERQRVTLLEHDILLLRTGWLRRFYEDPDGFSGTPFCEPGLLHSPELVDWFHRLEIPALCTDTLGNEVTIQPVHGENSALHAALMRNLGVVFTEMLWLEDLADDCEADGQYAFMYAAAPLKVFGGSGAPTNPIAIK